MLFFFVTFDYWDAYYYAAMDQPIDVFYGVGLIRLDVSPSRDLEEEGSFTPSGTDPGSILVMNLTEYAQEIEDWDPNQGIQQILRSFPSKNRVVPCGAPTFTVFYGVFFWKKHGFVSFMFHLFSFIYVSVLILNSSFGCLLFVAPLVLIGGLGICMPKFFAQYPLETKYIHYISWYFMWIYRHYIGIQLLQRLYIYIFKTLCICIDGL